MKGMRFKNNKCGRQNMESQHANTNYQGTKWKRFYTQVRDANEKIIPLDIQSTFGITSKINHKKSALTHSLEEILNYKIKIFSSHLAKKICFQRH